MTGQQRDFEEVLSRVLQTATDQIEPVGDGLTKIRGRLTEPWLVRQWWLLRNELMTLRWLVVVRSESLADTVRSRFAAANVTTSGAAGTGTRGRLASLPVLGGIIARASSKGGPGGDPRRSLGPVLNWLRPALAVAGAVVLVVVGVFALGQIRQGIVSLNANGGITTGTSSQSGGNGITNGQGGRSSAGGSGAASTGSRTGQKPGVTHHVGASSSASPCVTPSSSPQPSSPAPSSPPPPPSPTPSPTTSPTTTPTPTPTPTPTSSSAPLSGFLSPAPLGELHGASTTALVCAQPGPTPTSVVSPA